MAQSEGPPRKTETYNTFEGMNTQNERYGIEKEWFAWLENIMWVGPHKLHSVPGPRAIAIMPVPPIPPPTPCPPDTTVTHIDTGFTLSLTISSVVLDQVTDPDNPVAYSFTGFNRTNYMQKFNLMNHVVAWEVALGDNIRWQYPGVDFSNGHVYVQEQNNANERFIVHVNPVDGSEIARTPAYTSSQINVTTQAIKVTSDSIYGIFSSPAINIVWCVDKAGLTLRWTNPSLGSGLGTANRIAGMAIDGGENLWVSVGDATSRGLIQVNKTTGAGTLHDISAFFTAGQNITYDPTNNTFLLYGSGNVFRYDLSDNSLHDLGFNSTGYTTANMNQNVVNGRIWLNQSNRIQERDAFTGALLQEIFKIDMVGGPTVSSWFGMTLMVNPNCLMASHQSIGTGLLGGVDTICLPCTSP